MVDAGAFTSLKGRYGTLLFAVIDHESRFRYLHYGYPASSGGKPVQRVNDPMMDPQYHFGAMKYILEENDLVAGHNCVIMYVKLRRSAVLRGRKAYFNSRAVQARVGIEQSFGMLKSRFPALRSLRHRLRTRRGHATAHSMILAAAVFHNLLLDISEPIDIEDVEDDWYPLDGDGNGNLEDVTVMQSYERREASVDEMLALEDKDVDLDHLELWCTSYSLTPSPHLA